MAKSSAVSKSRTASMFAAFSPQVRILGPLVLWTLFVWSTRIRNIADDDGLDFPGRLLRLSYSMVFIGFALLFAHRLVVRRRTGLTGRDRGLLGVFCAWTIGFWLVRGVGIALGDHSAGFIAVHVVLMAVSIGLAARAAALLLRPARPTR